MNHIIKVLATGLGLGYAPKAPGTAGSVLGMVLVFFLQGFSIHGYLLFTLGFSLIAIAVSSQAEVIFKEHDSQKIVIDEIAGIVVTFIWIPLTWPTALAGFILFRFFDIVKIPPVKQSQRLPRGWGVVVDDLLAGVYANIVLQIGVTVWYAVAA